MPTIIKGEFIEVGSMELAAVHPDMHKAVRDLNIIHGIVCEGGAISLIRETAWCVNDGIKSDGRINNTGEPNISTGLLTEHFKDALVIMLNRANFPIEVGYKGKVGEEKPFLAIKQSELLKWGGATLIADNLEDLSHCARINYAGVQSDRPDVEAGVEMLNSVLPRMLHLTGRELDLPRWAYAYDRGTEDANQPLLRLKGLTSEQMQAVTHTLWTAGLPHIKPQYKAPPIVNVQGWEDISKYIQYPEAVKQHILATLPPDEKPRGGWFSRFTEAKRSAPTQ